MIILFSVYYVFELNHIWTVGFSGCYFCSFSAAQRLSELLCFRQRWTINVLSAKWWSNFFLCSIWLVFAYNFACSLMSTHLCCNSYTKEKMSQYFCIQQMYLLLVPCTNFLLILVILRSSCSKLKSTQVSLHFFFSVCCCYTFPVSKVSWYRYIVSHGNLIKSVKLSVRDMKTRYKEKMLICRILGPVEVGCFT